MRDDAPTPREGTDTWHMASARADHISATADELQRTGTGSIQLMLSIKRGADWYRDEFIRWTRQQVATPHKEKIVKAFNRFATWAGPEIGYPE